MSTENKNITKADIVKVMKDKYPNICDLPFKDLQNIVDCFLEEYLNTIINKKRVELRNFGVMRATLIRGKLINHPTTKEEAISTPHYRLSFTPSKKLKEKLNQKARQDVKKS